MLDLINNTNSNNNSSTTTGTSGNEVLTATDFRLAEQNDMQNDSHKGDKSYDETALSQIRLASLKEELLQLDADLCKLTATMAADRLRADCSLTASHDNSDKSAPPDSPVPPSSPLLSGDDQYNSIESSFSSSGIETSHPSSRSSSSSSSSPYIIVEQQAAAVAAHVDVNGLTTNHYSIDTINQFQSNDTLIKSSENVQNNNDDQHQQQEQQAAMPRRSRSLVDDARLDTQRNKQLLDEIRTEASKQLAGASNATSPLSSATQTGPHTIDELDESNDKQVADNGLQPLTSGDAQQQPQGDAGAVVGVGVDPELLDEAREIERSLVDFPRHISDLDHCNHLLIKYEPELDPTHPGFHDLEYRQRRKEVAEVAFNYKFGDKIPCIQYNDKELAAWKTIYLRLKEAYTKYACEQHNNTIRQLEAEHIYSPNYIPQLQTVSEFLEKRTGWRLRPVAGLLSARDFLSSLAFRVFQTTQYIRHWGNPEHSVEPDCIHELMGHIPMLCDPEFAQFSQELGLASLGASDEQIEKFATLYWFTVEFGLCKEKPKNGAIPSSSSSSPIDERKQLKCYGAGLLSSYGEMEHALESGKPALKEFVPEETAMETYDDSEYQVVYYVANSFEEAKAKIRAYAANNMEGRKFELAYDPYSCTIRELSSYDQLEVFANTIKCDINRLSSAISKLKTASV